MSDGGFLFSFVFMHGNGVTNGRKGRVSCWSAWHGHRHRDYSAFGGQARLTIGSV